MFWSVKDGLENSVVCVWHLVFASVMALLARGQFRDASLGSADISESDHRRAVVKRPPKMAEHKSADF